MTHEPILKNGQPTSERIDGPTPRGGAYGILYYQDADGNPTTREEAVRAEGVEYDEAGKMICSTLMTSER